MEIRYSHATLPVVEILHRGNNGTTANELKKFHKKMQTKRGYNDVVVYCGIVMHESS